MSDRTNFDEAHPALGIEMFDDEGEQVEIPEERLPRLMGWTVLLRPWTAPKKTKGGVLLPDPVVDANEFMTYVFQVVRLGPLAFRAPKLRGGVRHGWRHETENFEGSGVDTWEEFEEVKFAEGQEPPKPGDWVILRKYSGIRLELEGVSFKIAADDDVLAVIDSPSGWRAYI